ncbi:hypothetical protein, partial [Duodenibacillus massiliensis]|uniref:hypothetical protein n=1 Tax=Duodenibacillus massiliensis TaxID=1852381 RepID=UPI003AB5B8C5
VVDASDLLHIAGSVRTLALNDRDVNFSVASELWHDCLLFVVRYQNYITHHDKIKKKSWKSIDFQQYL